MASLRPHTGRDRGAASAARALYHPARGPSFPPVRTLTALALAVLACAPADRGDAPPARDANPTAAQTGPDPIVLRIPRDGGAAIAYRYPALDSAVWRSGNRLSPPARVLAFDAEEGALAYVDTAGAPRRLDLRLGTVSAAPKVRLSAIASADAEAIYGIDGKGQVVRLTPSGEDWQLALPSPARAALPQPDGWLVVLADGADGKGENEGGESVLWRLRPPEKGLFDTLTIPRASRSVRTHVGDRIYLAAGDRIVGINSRSMELVPEVELDEAVRVLAPTPSGDRVFVATDSSDRIAIVDRYSEGIADRVTLPGYVRDLRMDPLGRYLLVRPSSGDSAWVVSVSRGELVGTVATGWRADLPFVAPDGALALLRGEDVVLADAASGTVRQTVEDGAGDFWYSFSWNGFRPRSEGLDQPVEFRVREQPADTTPPDTLPPPPDSAQPPARDTVVAPPSRPPASNLFTVSFAALLNQESARELASEIEVGGYRARVVVGQRSGTPIYRVVLGPYATRADAEAVGRASGRQYIVYEGNP